MSTATVHHPLFARFYTRVLSRNEPAEIRAHREELLTGIAGHDARDRRGAPRLSG